MTAGFQLFNDFGSTLIDADLMTLAFRSKSSLTVPSGSATGSRVATLELSNVVSPQVFVRPHGSGHDKYFLVSQRPKPGDATKLLVDVGVWFDASARTFDVYHFDVTTDSGNSGLRLYDAAGRCTFNSDLKPCLVEHSIFETPYEGEIYWDDGLFEPTNYLVTQSTGELFAVGGTAGYWREYFNQERGPHRAYATKFKINGSSVEVWPQGPYIDYGDTVQSPYTVLDYWTGSPGALVINVTGY